MCVVWSVTGVTYCNLVCVCVCVCVCVYACICVHTVHVISNLQVSAGLPRQEFANGRAPGC